jgi:hypothetical protein
MEYGSHGVMVKLYFGLRGALYLIDGVVII